MALQRTTARESFFEVLERVLDKGIVIDAAVQISVAGVEVLRVDAWVVVASIETYLRHDDLARRIAAGEATAASRLITGMVPGMLEAGSDSATPPAPRPTREPTPSPEAEPPPQP